ncbi:MAG: hypothetical protein ACK559_28135, partial [bacterium]
REGTAGASGGLLAGGVGFAGPVRFGRIITELTGHVSRGLAHVPPPVDFGHTPIRVVIGRAGVRVIARLVAPSAAPIDPDRDLDIGHVVSVVAVQVPPDSGHDAGEGIDRGEAGRLDIGHREHSGLKGPPADGAGAGGLRGEREGTAGASGGLLAGGVGFAGPVRFCGIVAELTGHVSRGLAHVTPAVDFGDTPVRVVVGRAGIRVIARLVAPPAAAVDPDRDLDIG